MTVASYERDPATGGCLFPVVPKIIASTTPATTTSTRPNTPPDRQNTRSSNNPQQPLDIPTSFNFADRQQSTTTIKNPDLGTAERLACGVGVLE